MGDTPHGSTEYYTVFAVGMVLFVMTLLMNIVSQWMLNKMREKYE